MAILLPDLADENLTAQIERVAGYITDVQGTIKETLSDSPWGRRRLAYTIRFNGTDYRDGIYIIWHFDGDPSRMTEIERELKLDTRVIRYLLVHDDPKWGPKNGGNQPPRESEDSRDQAPTERTRPAATRPVEASAATEAVVEEAPATESVVEETVVAEEAAAVETTEAVVATEPEDAVEVETTVEPETSTDATEPETEASKED